MLSSMSVWDNGSFSDFIRLSCMEIVIVAILLGITIFRREISCNRCYTPEHSVTKNKTARTRMTAGISGCSTTVTSAYTTTTDSPSTRLSVLRRILGRRREATLESASSTVVTIGEEDQRYYFLDGVERIYSTSSIVVSFVTYLLVTPFSVLWYELPELLRKLLKTNEGHSIEDVLDSAGNFCSGQPLVKFWGSCKRMPSSIVISQSDCNPERIEDTVFSSILPLETTIHILSYVSSQDIVSGFGCVNKACYDLVNSIDEEDTAVVLSTDISRIQYDTSTSSQAATILLWKTIFERDYAWTVNEWNVGRLAKDRSLKIFTESNPDAIPNIEVLYSKDFYFRFSLCYVNYLLAGHNSTDNCLVGLGGHIFDMTSFLTKHPGSVETVLVHAGKDATAAFERMGHTSRARRIARQDLCIIVNSLRLHNTDASKSFCDAEPSLGTRSGLLPTSNLNEGSRQGESNDMSPEMCNNYPATINLSSFTSNIFQPGYRLSEKLSFCIPTVKKIRDDYYMEESNVASNAARQFGQNAIGEDVNVYYDPFVSKWKAWYICSESFQNKFVDFD